MTKIKNALIILALVLLTIGIIVIPSVVHSLSFEYSVDEKTFWKHSAQTNNQVTSQEIVELYSDSTGQQDSGAHQESANLRVSDNVSELLDLLFHDDTEICSYMKEIISHRKITFSQNYRLTSVNNNPVVLKIIDVTCVNINERIELTYEERSKTLISFSYYIQDYGQNNTLFSDKKDFLKNLEQLLKGYYENILKLEEGQYSFKTDDKGAFSCTLGK